MVFPAESEMRYDACNGIMSKAESKELSQVVVVDKSVGC